MLLHVFLIRCKNVLPALGGEHTFGFYRLSKLRKRHANHNRLHFLRFGLPLEASWGRLEGVLVRLGIFLEAYGGVLGRLGFVLERLGVQGLPPGAVLERLGAPRPHPRPG